MKIVQICQVSVFMTFGVAALTTRAQTPQSSSPANLAPIAFLTAHEWDAQLPNTPDGKKLKIHARFAWTQNHQAIRVSNQFVTDGKPSPYIDGLFAWDPQQHAIVFWYVGAEGSLTKGVLKPEHGKLAYEFAQTTPDGKTTEYTARITPNGETSWQNEVFVKNDKGVTPIVNVKYEAAQ